MLREDELLQLQLASSMSAGLVLVTPRRQVENDDVPFYVAASDVGSWDKVVIVSMRVILRSRSIVLNAPVDYYLANKTYHVSPGIMLAEIPLYISLREKQHE